MLGKKGPSVTKCVHYEIVTNRRIIPSFFSEIEIDLPKQSYQNDQLIIEISGKFAFEMYFDDVVVPKLDSSKLATDADKILADMWAYNDRYFQLSPVKTKGSALHYKIKKKNPYTYKIEVKSAGKCTQTKLKIYLYSTAVDIHDLAFNRKVLIKDFVSVKYSYKSTRKTRNCKFNQTVDQKDEKELEKIRIKIGNAPNNEDGRLRLIHTKQYMTLKALSRFKPAQLDNKGKSKQIVVTYVGPDDLTNMETALKYLKQICEDKEIHERKLYVRADTVNENTSDSKLTHIVKKFTGENTNIDEINQHGDSWHKSDVIIDTCTMNYWRFSNLYGNIDPHKTNLYQEEISNRISHLNPGGNLYLVFPSFVSGFGKIFDDDYRTMNKSKSISEFEVTNDVIQELKFILEEIKKEHPNIITNFESFDADGAYFVISNNEFGHTYQEEKPINTEWKIETSYVPISRTEDSRIQPIVLKIKKNDDGLRTKILQTDKYKTVKDRGYITGFAEDFVQQFVQANRTRIELMEMDELIPYLVRKDITSEDLLAYVGITGQIDERELIALIVDPIPIIKEQRNRLGELTHYEIQSESNSIWDYDFDTGEREILRAAAAAA